MGIVGYGNVGSRCARLAKAFGMKVVGLRKNPSLSRSDSLIDMVYGSGGLSDVMRESDYLVVTVPLTPATAGMIHTFDNAKENMVLINVSSPEVIAEQSLLNALGFTSHDLVGITSPPPLSIDRLLKGAALMHPRPITFAPLEESGNQSSVSSSSDDTECDGDDSNSSGGDSVSCGNSKIPWNILPNVLIPPRSNAGDGLQHSKLQAITIFNKNCEYFLEGSGELDNIVDKSVGY